MARGTLSACSKEYTGMSAWLTFTRLGASSTSAGTLEPLVGASAATFLGIRPPWRTNEEGCLNLSLSRYLAQGIWRYGLRYGCAIPTMNFQRLICRPLLLSRYKVVPLLL